MKILVIYPAYNWSTKDIADNILQAFKDLGHEVEQYPLYAVYMLYKRHVSLYETDETWRLVLTEALKEQVERAAYDFILVVQGTHIPPRRVEEMRKYCKHVGVWLLDEPYELDHSLTYSPYYSVRFINDPATLSYHTNAHYLPVAANSHIHYPQNNLGARYCYDVFFSGAYSKSHFAARRRILLELLPFIYNKRIYIQGMTHQGFIPYKMLPRFYAGSKVVLNLYREANGTGYGDLNTRNIQPQGVNPRAFEVPACGGLVVSDDRRSETKRLFPDAVTFKSVKDLRNIIEYYLTHEDERRVLIAKAPRYDYKQRAEEMLSILEGQGADSHRTTSSD